MPDETKLSDFVEWWSQTAMVKQIDAVAAAARELRRVRAEALPKIKGGLRALYRTLELPGANTLKDTHASLAVGIAASRQSAAI